MECNFCQSQQATIFLSQIFKGQVIKLDLCEPCARKLEVTDVQGVAVNELIQKIRRLQEEVSQDAEIKCPGCGISLAEMRKRGQLGCAQCYEAFASEVAEIIDDNQKGNHHHGKSPRKRMADVKTYQREDLQQRLQKAVESEDFETAARLRDELTN
jgi:protein arginine kinase activator